MAFETLINRLIPEGAVMAGQRPKTILEPGGEPGYYQTDPLSNLVRGLEQYQQQDQLKKEKLMKQQKSDFDMYKTLRDAGYEAKAAYEAVMSGKGPSGPGGETPEEKLRAAQTKRAEAGANKEQAAADKINKQAAGTGVKTVSLKDRILEKVAAGETLTPGEQKVYDDNIRKYGNKSEIGDVMDKPRFKEDAGAAAGGGAGFAPPEYVPMTDPTGKNKKVHRDDVKKALKKGWKMRISANEPLY